MYKYVFVLGYEGQSKSFVVLENYITYSNQIFIVSQSIYQNTLCKVSYDETNYQNSHAVYPLAGSRGPLETSGLSNLIPRIFSLTVGNKKKSHGPNLDCRGDVILIGPNFRPGSPVSWLRYVPKRCRGKEAGLWYPSLGGANYKLRRLAEDNGWCTNRHLLCDDPREELWQLYLPYRKKQQPFSSRRCDFCAPLMDDLLLETPILKIAALFRDHTVRISWTRLDTPLSNFLCINLHHSTLASICNFDRLWGIQRAASLLTPRWS